MDRHIFWPTCFAPLRWLPSSAESVLAKFFSRDPAYRSIARNPSRDANTAATLPASNKQDRQSASISSAIPAAQISTPSTLSPASPRNSRPWAFLAGRLRTPDHPGLSPAALLELQATHRPGYLANKSIAEAPQAHDGNLSHSPAELRLASPSCLASPSGACHSPLAPCTSDRQRHGRHHGEFTTRPRPALAAARDGSPRPELSTAPPGGELIAWRRISREAGAGKSEN